MTAAFLWRWKWVRKFSTCMVPMRKVSTSRSALLGAVMIRPPRRSANSETLTPLMKASWGTTPKTSMPRTSREGFTRSRASAM